MWLLTAITRSLTAVVQSLTAMEATLPRIERTRTLVGASLTRTCFRGWRLRRQRQCGRRYRGSVGPVRRSAVPDNDVDDAVADRADPYAGLHVLDNDVASPLADVADLYADLHIPDNDGDDAVADRADPYADLHVPDNDVGSPFANRADPYAGLPVPDNDMESPVADLADPYAALRVPVNDAGSTSLFRLPAFSLVPSFPPSLVPSFRLLSPPVPPVPWTTLHLTTAPCHLTAPVRLRGSPSAVRASLDSPETPRSCICVLSIARCSPRVSLS